MKRIFILCILLVGCKQQETVSTIDFKTVFEKTNGQETATYQETISYFTNLKNTYPEISMQTIGMTDSGKPLHIVTLNPDKEFNFENIRKNKRILLVNNGIHPGESDGIDATMMLFRDIVQGNIKAPKNTVLVTIPIYNIGGSLNRNSTTRTNQNGPKEYGFRGNSRNYDLNRDFIKCDTENAKSFASIFHLVQPDVFIDNHVSNGADYQYTLTHLFTQHNKLGGTLGNYIHTQIMPELESKLKEKNWDITPYVNVFNQVPEKGFSQFMDYPRYSTGYTTLWNTLGLMVETHMLKPYKQRVEGTYELMKSMLEIVESEGETITKMRNKNFDYFTAGNSYPLDWGVDTTKTSTLQFKGYEGTFINSDVTGLKRLKYNRNKPFIKDIAYKNYFKPTTEVTIPKAYVIPQGWRNIINLLEINNIKTVQFKKDTTLLVEGYKIANFNTRKTPYEGHYQHYDTQVISSSKSISFSKGDYLITTQQKGIRYLLETLEPQAPDSFFNWNFFDTILQQKEGFSPYVWEDIAHALLENDSELKSQFENKKQTDASFSKNWYLQLDWLHKHSDYYEKAHMQYPIYRLQ
ncbi:M14 family metallopeptidase [Corallibacter sp.]|uniref:M14 family metallopeptidase n=1 Tax=Corallibacter sp. TaxID=2038084 RepID=UPI003AB26A51